MRRPHATKWRRRVRSLADSLWVVPAAYVLGALVLGVVLLRWDENDPFDPSLAISAESASAALSALGGGMIVFTGFVTSVVLLVIQFGSVEFSPRLLRFFRRDLTLKAALGTFTATFVFALVATVQVGRGSDDFVPTRTLLAALGLTLLSIVMFLVLIDRTSNSLRVANVAQRLELAARVVFDAVYPERGSAAAAEQQVRDLRQRAPVQVVRNLDAGAILVTFDRESLVRQATEGSVVIELVRAVGDHVASGGALLNVYGEHELPARKLRRAVELGDERTLDYDPAFAIRILVDISIRALSPAVNDPTTAVQNLGRIEDLLGYAASKELSVGFATDAAGAARLVYPTPTWDDLVALALDEIRAFGAGQYQIARRMRALLDALEATVPEPRLPALARQRQLLDDAVAARFPESQRADALVADRQGLGMGSR